MTLFRGRLIDTKFILLCISWAFPTFNFVLNPGYNPSSFPTYFALVVSIYLIYKNKEYFSYSVPFIALLSPISQKTFNALPSEIFILLCFTFGLIFIFFNGITIFRVHRSDKYLIGMLICILVLYILSLEYNVLFKAMMRWIMLITVFVLTRKTIRDDYQINKFLVVIVIASLFSSLISLVSWFEGVNLSDFMDTVDDEKVINVKEDISWYFRAQYFYNNIAYIIAPALLISFFKVRNKQKIFTKMIYFLMASFFFIILLLMNEKTGLLSVIVTAVLLSFFVQGPFQVKGLVYKSSFVIVMSIFLSFLTYQIFKVSTYYSFNIWSFYERVCVVQNMFATMFQHPIHFFFGFGPDSSNLLHNELTYAAQLNCDGTLQGAIDSGWFTFLFEYGVLFFIFFIIYNLYCIKNTLYINKKKHAKSITAISLLALLVYVNTAALTDVIGAGKIGWVVSQYYAMVSIFISQKLKLIL